MTHSRIFTGKRGEDEAQRFLARNGYRVVCTNYRCRYGEVDIIAMDGATLVFVEVKTRSSDRFGTPEASVDERKQRRVIAAARHYLNEKGITDRDVRFDVVGVDSGGGRLKTGLVKDAFTAEE